MGNWGNFYDGDVGACDEWVQTTLGDSKSFLRLYETPAGKKKRLIATYPEVHTFESSD